MSENLQSLRERVAANIAGSTPGIADQIVQAMAEVKINERAATLTKAIEALGALNKEHQKSRPDQISVSQDGTKLEAWSTGAYEIHWRRVEQIDRLTAAIDGFLGADATYSGKAFEALNQIVQKLGGKKGESGS